MVKSILANKKLSKMLMHGHFNRDIIIRFFTKTWAPVGPFYGLGGHPI